MMPLITKLGTERSWSRLLGELFARNARNVSGIFGNVLKSLETKILIVLGYWPLSTTFPMLVVANSYKRFY